MMNISFFGCVNEFQIVSCMSSCTLEEVALSCNAVRFLQIYVSRTQHASLV